jgi:capsular exopolysaccharide synthesis family protein
MGRLTEAMRRAADVAEKEAVQGPNDAVELPTESLTDATDDLFPIEIGHPAPASAGAAVIMPSVLEAPPPIVMPAAAAEPAALPVEIPLPAPPARAPRQSELFERLDATLAQKIVVDHNTMPVSREQYRRLAATLHHAQADMGLKVVMIASAVVGEGKTLTASNLALTFSESYKRSVLLIDGDFRRPALHVVFNIDAPSGLSEGLMSVVEHKLPLYRVSERLTILPAGRPSSDPMAGLTSGRMRRVIQEARDAFDWVIIDTPPVGLLPDANLLAAMVDGAVLVVRANSTPYHQVQRAIDALDRNRLLGVVLNSVNTPINGTHHYYSYYHGARTQAADPQ